jgi:hypothetical protein
MNITNKEIGGVSVVAFNGRIVLGEESAALREEVKACSVQERSALF